MKLRTATMKLGTAMTEERSGNIENKGALRNTCNLEKECGLFSSQAFSKRDPQQYECPHDPVCG